MGNSYSGLDKKTEKEVKNTLKQTEKEMNTIEVEQVKELLKKYDIVLKNDIDENDLILKYETFYDQLNEYVINKRKNIKDVEGLIDSSLELSNDDNFTTILNKKKENTNQIIDCDNRIVERIRKLETIIYKNRMKELNNMIVERYELKKVELRQPIKVDDNEINIINNSMDVLIRWSKSKRATLNIIFDSRVDGDGSNNVLHNRVIGKSNLYFITSDTNNNVFGGFVKNEIKSHNSWVVDFDVFVFSLIRNGKVNNKKYLIKGFYGAYAFQLCYNDPEGYLYKFSEGMHVKRMGSKKSWWDWIDYYYDYEFRETVVKFAPLIDCGYARSTFFQAKRIIVVEVNKF